MPRTATESFLIGRKARNTRELLDITFLVVGQHPHRAGWMWLQETDGRRRFVAVRTEDVRPLPTAEQVGWDIITGALPPHG